MRLGEVADLVAPRNRAFDDCIGVFQGGGCRASAYAGAFSAAVDQGVSFDELAGASAGAIVAVLVAAGAQPDWLEEQLRALDFRDLLRKPSGRRLAFRGRTRFARLINLLRFGGLHSSSQIEIWVEKRLRELVPSATNRQVEFRDLPKDVSVVAGDLKQRRQVVWSTHTTPQMPVAEAVRSSCSIPVFFQPHHGVYVDGGIVSNLPVHIVDNDSADQRRVLAFQLVEDTDPMLRKDLASTLGAVANTVVEGAQQIQASLRSDIDLITIRTGGVRATDFANMTDERIDDLVDAGRTAVEQFFGKGTASAKPRAPISTSNHLAHTLVMIAETLLAAEHSVLIADSDTKWVFDLYSALVLARLRDVEIRVLLPAYSGSRPQDLLQRNTLQALGCHIQFVPADTPMSIRAVVCDPGTHAARAVVTGQPDLEIHARSFTAADGDDQLINVLAEGIRDQFDPATPCHSGAIALRPVEPAAVLTNLRTVQQYRGEQTLDMESIPLGQIDSWARYAHAYKQIQQEHMLVELRKFGIEPFGPHAVVYGNGYESLAVPIVVEANPNGRFTLVNGLSRLLALKREGQVVARCAVARGVSAEPPADGVRELSYLGVRVGLRSQARHRYPGFAYRNMRKVEQTAHDLVLAPKGEYGGEYS